MIIPGSNVRRLLILHAKSASTEETNKFVANTRAALRAQAQDVGVEYDIVTARDDFEKRGLLAGGWDGWCRSMVDILDPVSRVPRFHGFVVPALDPASGTVRIGNATATILRFAREAGRDVLVLVDERLVAPTGARTINKDDWRAGWAVDFTPV
jgi:hypothetical protein